MIHFKTIIKKFGAQGEKTGWTYVIIPAEIASQLKPGFKKSFRVKGKLDNHAIKGIALLPMGEGDFIIPINAMMRKAIGKRQGEKLELKLEEDTAVFKHDKDFILCIDEEPDSKNFFSSLPQSHQNYFSKWIASAKTAETKSKRIAMAINAFAKKQGYPEMMREAKAFKNI
ncbi:MAG: YdeI/OmpD-associated family protein [Chitinophagales bacterium]|nr:YdeI/OmpD-associated family protein [Chitinophagales bacterium]